MKLVETSAEFEEWCLVHGYSKGDIADILGVTRQTIYNWTHRKYENLNQPRTTLETRIKLQHYEKIPRMLTLSLFALEKLEPGDMSVMIFGEQVRKQSGKPKMRA